MVGCYPIVPKCSYAASRKVVKTTELICLQIIKKCLAKITIFTNF